MNHSSTFLAPTGKRVWAAFFDLLVVSVSFLLISAISESEKVDLRELYVFGIVHFAYHFFCLAVRDGRTLGKTAVDICVVTPQGDRVTTLTAAMRAGFRSLPFLIAIFPNFDLFGFVLALFMLTVEVHMLDSSPAKQTLADSIARTLVVNLPPVQPHRAPAGPMYSAEDVEFGVPPKKPASGRGEWRK